KGHRLTGAALCRGDARPPRPEGADAAEILKIERRPGSAKRHWRDLPPDRISRSGIDPLVLPNHPSTSIPPIVLSREGVFVIMTLRRSRFSLVNLAVLAATVVIVFA